VRNLDALRRHAVARSLFAPTGLLPAIRRLGFLQADPIRAPARAQDLILRLRVRDYRAGDLERRYPRLPIDEEYYLNYGFLPSEHLSSIHPRVARHGWDATMARRAAQLLEFVRAAGRAHPREIQAAFPWGPTRNDWGGQSHASTRLLDAMHYRGLLRVQRREAGLRVYEPVRREPDGRDPGEKAAALVDLAVQLYAPLPAPCLRLLCTQLRARLPHLAAHLKAPVAGVLRRFPSARIDGLEWIWPPGENPFGARGPRDALRRADDLALLAPFDPLVWDRQRFELFFGWPYRFEAYTPAARRQCGYYALPMLWRGNVPGWVNLKVAGGRLRAECGYVSGHAPRDPSFARALEAELARMSAFLGITAGA
jgi:uncharacterized protein YcaQ